MILIRASKTCKKKHMHVNHCYFICQSILRITSLKIKKGQKATAASGGTPSVDTTMSKVKSHMPSRKVQHASSQQPPSHLSLMTTINQKAV